MINRFWELFESPETNVRASIGELVPIPTAPANVLVPVVLVAATVPNTPRVEARLATPLVVVAPDWVKKFVNIGVVVATSVPFALTARNVLARLVTANEVEVALASVVLPVTLRVPVAVTLAAVRLPLKYPLPFTSNLFEGDVVAIPTLPFALTRNKEDVANAAEVVVAMSKSGVTAPNAFWSDNIAAGVVVPMPTNPLLRTVKSVVEAAELALNTASVEVPQTVKVEFGAVLLPILTLAFTILPWPSAEPNTVSTGLPLRFALYDSIVPVAEADVIGKSTHDTWPASVSNDMLPIWRF